MDKARFGTPSIYGRTAYRRAWTRSRIIMKALVAPTLHLWVTIHSKTHPHENPVYVLRAWSYLQFNYNVNIKEFQNYNSSINLSPKIIITFFISTMMASKSTLETEIITFHQTSVYWRIRYFYEWHNHPDFYSSILFSSLKQSHITNSY